MADRTAAVLGPAIRRYASGRLLDLGAGKAPLYGLYGPLVDTVTCVDWAVGSHGTDYLDLTHDLNEGIPFDRSAFDTVLSTSVFEHIREPSMLFAEVARVLSPEGHLILNVPFLYWLHEEPHDYFRYTEHALRHFCQSNGLAVVTLAATGDQFDVVIDIACKSLSRVPAIVRLAARVAGGRGPRRCGHCRFPLGYVLVAQRLPETVP